VRRNLLTIALVGLVLLLLVGLNLIFISEGREEETELTGDRSTYRATPFGTLAFYTLLAEQGRDVARFEQPFTSLSSSSVSTFFVVVPANEIQPTEAELDALEEWVGGGGDLVVVDRVIQVKSALGEFETGGPIGGNVRAVAPSAFTRGVAELKVTDFATSVTDARGESAVHFAGDNGPLLIDKPYGEGHVTLLTEPYVIQNNGIGQGDNLALALNLVDALGRKGRIAFDEYHHGHGAAKSGGRGGLREYVAGTPVPWILLQRGLIAAVAAATIGSRFGRAVPLKTERRTSALEFVSSMANIQRLARASDLAVENVYSSFRARLCRYANVPSDAPVDEIARAAAARGQVDAGRLRDVMLRCEAALAGEQPSPKELVDLVAELRRIEAALKL
jgi:hypothetical protein